MDLTSIIVLIISTVIGLISGLVSGFALERVRHRNELAKLKADYDLKQKESFIKKTMEVRGLAWEKAQKTFRATEFLLSRVQDNVSGQILLEERIKAGATFNDLNNYLAPNSIYIPKGLFLSFAEISKNLAKILHSFDIALEMSTPLLLVYDELHKTWIQETVLMLDRLEDLLRKETENN